MGKFNNVAAAEAGGSCFKLLCCVATLNKAGSGEKNVPECVIQSALYRTHAQGCNTHSYAIRSTVISDNMQSSIAMHQRKARKKKKNHANKNVVNECKQSI